MRQLLDALQVYQPERVYVFGSWARGEADELSDLDLVVIKSTTVPFFERLREVSRLLGQVQWIFWCTRRRSLRLCCRRGTLLPK